METFRGKTPVLYGLDLPPVSQYICHSSNPDDVYNYQSQTMSS